MGSCKHYVDVTVYHSSDGTLVPMSVIWDDGTEFEIDRVFTATRAASMKAGGAGTRYTVRIKGHMRYLWLEEGRWFVEAPA